MKKYQVRPESWRKSAFVCNNTSRWTVKEHFRPDREVPCSSGASVWTKWIHKNMLRRFWGWRNQQVITKPSRMGTAEWRNEKLRSFYEEEARPFWPFFSNWVAITFNEIWHRSHQIQSLWHLNVLTWTSQSGTVDTGPCPKLSAYWFSASSLLLSYTLTSKPFHHFSFSVKPSMRTRDFKSWSRRGRPTDVRVKSDGSNYKPDWSQVKHFIHHSGTRFGFQSLMQRSIFTLASELFYRLKWFSFFLCEWFFFFFFYSQGVPWCRRFLPLLLSRMFHLTLAFEDVEKLKYSKQFGF